MGTEIDFRMYANSAPSANSEDSYRMRTLLYTEAPMVYEETADQVRELWKSVLIPDDLAALAWGIG